MKATESLPKDRRWSQAVEALPVPVWLTDDDGRCVYVNLAWQALFARPVRLDHGYGWLESVHPDDRVECLGAFQQAFEAGVPFLREYRVQRHDQSWGWVLGYAVPYRASDSTFLGYVGTLLDLTEQRNAREALSRRGHSLELRVRQTEHERAVAEEALNQELAERERLSRELERVRENLRTVSQRLLEAQEGERRRIARALHDEVGQALVALRMDLQTLSGLEQAGAPLEDALAGLDATLDRVRALSLDLRPPLLDDLGLGEALRSYLERCCRRAQLTWDLHLGDLPAVLSPGVQITCFRIVQEAVTNVLKHAGAAHLEVSVGVEEGVLSLRVGDDGVGFDSAEAPLTRLASRGLGLLHMQERAVLAGGRFEIDARPGRGTRIRADIPLQVADSAAT